MEFMLILFSIFAAYGVYESFSKVYGFLLSRKQKKPIQYILIVSKNNRDSIEYSIRNAIDKLPYGFEDVLIMDLESTDGTEDIIRRFEAEDKVRIVKWKQ